MSANPAVTGEPQPKLRADAARNRARILTAAAEAFAEGGLAVTMDEIDALFEQRIAELVALAEEAREATDAWEGLVHFFEAGLALQAADRGLKEVLLGSGHGQDRVTRARARISPVIEELVRRAKAEGRLRPDVEAPDLGIIQFMLGALADSTRDIDPGQWRRFLAIVLDGLRTRRDAPTPLGPGPLDERRFDEAMAAWRTPAR
jgi:AcrR family transcriptional regulator